MKKEIIIDNIKIGKAYPCYLIAEIGINHNGDMNTAKKLIDKAADYGFNAVKFQKRTIDLVYTPEELALPRESVFGKTNGDLKRGLEFGEAEYKEIDRYCKTKNISWFCSPWDIKSVEFLEKFNPVCYKIASASLTDAELLTRINSTGRPVILSTGMSTLAEIDAAVRVLSNVPLAIMHCTSTYPSEPAELNLSCISHLRERYQCPIGYSGHESGVMPSVMAVTGFNASLVERHITLNRAMWGSDQAASLEPRGMELLARYIRLWPVAKGDGIKKVYDSEVPIRAKLRKKEILV